MASTYSLRALTGRQPVLGNFAPLACRLFSTTASLAENKIRKPRKKNKGPGAKTSAAKEGKRARRDAGPAQPEGHELVQVLKRNLFSPAPPPLRMARLRYLRHWTIHRAWQLFRRKQHEAINNERQRMYASMYNACEELRKTVGPHDQGEGYLYRVAMEEKGVYGHNGVPIEYARLQTDSPATTAWDHEWTK